MSDFVNLQSYPKGAQENLRRLHESLSHASLVLGAIKDEIESGSYTRQSASNDAEAVTMTEGLDFISALMDVAEDECAEW
jgi:hypothetical protein